MRWLITICLLWPFNTQAAPVDDLIYLLNDYRHFSAEFEQVSLSANGTKGATLRGEVAIAGQDLFYWQTYAPLAQVIVADGEVLWIYDEDLLQVQVRPLDDSLDTSPASILGGNATALNRQFNIEYEARETLASYILTPHAPENITRKIVLRFDGSRLVSLEIDDALGNKTRIKLVSVDRSSPNSAFFAFEPPPGVDVIYALGNEY